MNPMLKQLIHRVATLATNVDVVVGNKWTKVNIQLIQFILQYSIC